MTQERWVHLQELYFRIEAMSPSERASAIAEASADDPQLRTELESLFRVEEGALSEPALGRGFNLAAAMDGDGPGDADLAGTILGRYRVERLIAHGGMGEVYLASREVDQIRTPVALKVVRRGSETADVLRRFRAERQTLARLDHPNIARLLDGGMVPDGRPYLVLEFVDGRRIDEHCRERGLSLRERLRLFMTVCSAVQYAHQNLVIHRDLKPSNILVTADGTPKLLDFGIARLLEPDAAEGRTMTTADQRRLTPEYASPEQLEGRAVTTATDVYSLGVILYELLAGAGPYQLATRSTEEVRRAMATQEPSAPSAAARRSATGSAGATGTAGATRTGRELRGDLDTIVLKALRKEPERRYSSAEQLAQDIERYLRGLPVIARNDTLGYRARKFVRRNAALTGVVAVSAAGLISLAVVAQVNARAAARERDAAVTARSQADEAVEFLRTILASADPSLHGPDVPVRTLLSEADARAAAELSNAPLVHATVEHALGSAYVGLNDYDAARGKFESALATRRELLGERHPDTARIMAELAVIDYQIGRYEEAERAIREALEIFVAAEGPESANVAKMRNVLGGILTAQGKTDEGMEQYELALAARKRILGPQDLSVAQTLNNIGNIHFRRGDLDGAEQALSESLAIRRAKEGDDHPLIAQSLSNLASVHHARGGADNAAEAERLLREALEIYDRTLPKDHTARATTMNSIAILLRGRGAYREEERALREVLATFQAKLSPGDKRTLNIAARLIDALMLAGDFDAAEKAIEEARGLVPPGHGLAEAFAATLDQMVLELSAKRGATSENRIPSEISPTDPGPDAGVSGGN